MVLNANIKNLKNGVKTSVNDKRYPPSDVDRLEKGRSFNMLLIESNIVIGFYKCSTVPLPSTVLYTRFQ